MKILVINGPNINLLGIREKNIYGNQSYQFLEDFIKEVCREEEIEVKLFQSNHEGAIIDIIQEAYENFDGIIINPAAFTHTSIAIADALAAVAIPAVEVHISNIAQRESFRQISFVADICKASVMGKGIEGYKDAILILKEYLTKDIK